MCLALNLNNVNKVQQIIALGLVSLLVWQLASSVWFFVSPEPPAQTHGMAFSPSATNKIHPLDIKHITALHLFGVPTFLEQGTDQENRQIIAPETSLNLKLRGLRKGQGSIKSSAIIEDQQGVQALYYLGDEVHGHSEVKIYEIYSQHLILERAGKYETLTLFDVLQQKKSNQVEGEHVLKSTGFDLRVIDKTTNRDLTRRLAEVAATIKTSPLSLKGRMNIQPLTDKNGFQGYKVAPGNDKLLFSRLGFLKDDVITHINDIELDGPDKVIQLVGVLSSVEVLDIKVRRGRQPLLFKYSVK